MKHIAIVDDDANFITLLNTYLERYQEEQQIKLKVSQFSDGDEIALGYTAKYDVIFMDVEMSFMDGMAAAGRIRAVDAQVIIIFITNMPQYAIKGYTVDAMDYLLKPLNYFAFSQCLDRALQRLSSRAATYITISVKGGFRKIDTAQLYYIEVQDHNLLYHTKDETISTFGTMRKIEDQLAGGRFFRCNKGYLVNLEHVTGVQDGCIIVGGDEVQVSRAKKKELMDALNNYMQEVNT